MNCDRCQSDATWLVFATYGRHSDAYVATYPMPMGRLCSDHLGPFLADDMEHPGASSAWLVRPRPTSEPT